MTGGSVTSGKIVKKIKTVGVISNVKQNQFKYFLKKSNNENRQKVYRLN